jgi:hypothetical protein
MFGINIGLQKVFLCDFSTSLTTISKYSCYKPKKLIYTLLWLAGKSAVNFLKPSVNQKKIRLWGIHVILPDCQEIDVDVETGLYAKNIEGRGEKSYCVYGPYLQCSGQLVDLH